MRVTDNGTPQLGTTTSFMITVTSSPQSTLFSVVSGSEIFGATATLSATLSAGVSPLAGKTVTFTLHIGGTITTAGTATTDSEGVATLTGVGPTGLNAGTSAGVVAASFSGDSIDAATSAIGDLVVNPAPATLSLSGLVFTYDDSPVAATITTNPVGLSDVVVSYTMNNIPVAAPTQAGSYSIVASINNPNYAAPNVTGTLIISPTTPTITWVNPSDIVYGTPLGSAQLDPTASVAGTFAFAPTSGTFLNAGQGQTLSATFTPDDATDYKAVPVTAQINVAPAPLTVAADDASMVAGQALPTFTARYTGFVRGEGPSVLGGVLSLSVPAGAGSQAGSYPIALTGLSSSSYAISYQTGTLTVTSQPIPPAPLVTVPSVHWQTEKLSRHKTAKVLVVTFSGTLNANDAQNALVYNLVAAGKDKKFGTKDDKPVKIASAVYNSGANTVTLTPRGPVPNQSLQLTISAGQVLDIEGRQIDGNRDGQPGGNFGHFSPISTA